jgi:general stress protein 26
MDSMQGVAELLRMQRFGVLATDNVGKPHNCLVAFAEENNLKCLLFATDRNTRKFRDVKVNPNVAILIDNRSNSESDLSNAIAVTARGSAQEASIEEHKQFAKLYLAKHPYLADFVSSPETALIKIIVNEYIVAVFKETYTLKLED